MSRNFLFVLWAGGGNVGPQMGVARNLARRGASVRVLAPATLRGRITDAGLTFEGYQRTPEHDEATRETSLIRDFEAKTPAGAVARARTRLFAGTAAEIAADTFDAIDRSPTDLVVFDYMLMGAGFGAEKAGVPAAGPQHEQEVARHCLPPALTALLRSSARGWSAPCRGRSPGPPRAASTRTRR